MRVLSNQYSVNFFSTNIPVEDIPPTEPPQPPETTAGEPGTPEGK